MAESLLKYRLKKWRGSRSLKEAAAALGVDYPTYRKYETGKRNPCKLAAQQIDQLLLQRTP
jgi:transcriptional regulator with XRE-family HTH domain